jgi:shikimate kinase
MTTRTNIVLIGFMGTGKTTVGKLLAARLELAFTDMDDCIVERAGKSIPAIFADDGEPAFRALERQVVIALSARRGLVIATGGGVVLNPGNTRDLGANGLLVALTASPDVILERLRHDSGRPLLSAGDKGEKIRTLLAARQHLYNAIPARIDTDALTSEAVAQRIMELYARHNA